MKATVIARERTIHDEDFVTFRVDGAVEFTDAAACIVKLVARPTNVNTAPNVVVGSDCNEDVKIECVPGSYIVIAQGDVDEKFFVGATSDVENVAPSPLMYFSPECTYKNGKRLV